MGHDYEKAHRFEEILEHFFRDKPKYVRVHLETVLQGKHNKRWLERDIAREWAVHHEKHALLRMETRAENLRGNRGFAAKNELGKRTGRVI